MFVFSLSFGSALLNNLSFIFHYLEFLLSSFAALPRLNRMSPALNPTRPTTLDRFFAKHQYPILMGTFATQVLHYQFIRRAELAVDSPTGSVRASSFPRPLRAGLAWGLVFVGLLTKITLSQKTVRDYSDPIVAHSLQKKQWRSRVSETSI
jgi:hypothetical protein